MVWIPGGVYAMGSDVHYADEAPARHVRVSGFWMQATAVTNRSFARFVAATGYRTLAERPLDAAQFPGAAPELLAPGALVFRQPAGPVAWNMGHWWAYVPGANWRHPQGPGSTIAGLQEHPVVQIAFEDAEAYAQWAGLALPTEAQWEFAARGGLAGAAFAWGDTLMPGGQAMANFWQGEFPHENLCLDGYAGTAPVRAFLPNGFGLFEMTGNVWEWTADWYGVPRTAAAHSKPCCIPTDPRGAIAEQSHDAREPGIGRKVIKGGSFLCAPNYCQRYRPAARQPQAVDSATCHIGFRCVAPGPV